MKHKIHSHSLDCKLLNPLGVRIDPLEMRTWEFFSGGSFYQKSTKTADQTEILNSRFSRLQLEDMKKKEV